MEFKKLNKHITEDSNEIKNFKQLANILGINTNTTDSRSKKRVLDKLDLFYRFDKEGHRFVFDENETFDVFYDIGKPLTRKEKNNYINLISDSIVYNLSKLKDAQDTDEIFGSTNFILMNLSLINKRFAYALKHIKLLSEQSGIHETVFEEFFRLTKRKLDGDLKKALNDLTKKSLVSWENVLITRKIDYNPDGSQNGVKGAIATKDEHKLYLHCSKVALDKLGLSNTSEIYRKGLADKYYRYVDEELQSILEDEDKSFDFNCGHNIVGFYKGYRIIYNIDEIIDYRDKRIDVQSIKKLNRFKQLELAQNAENRVFNKLMKNEGISERADFKYVYDIVLLINNFIADDDNKALLIDDDWEIKNNKIKQKINNILPEKLPTIDDIDYDSALKEWEDWEESSTELDSDEEERIINELKFSIK